MSDLEIIRRLTALEKLVARLGLQVEMVHDLEFGEESEVVGKGIDDGERLAEHVGHFPFVSRPLDGGDGLVVKLAQQGTTMFLVGYRFRDHEIVLDKGEAAIVDDQGQRFFLKRNGVEMQSGGAVFRINRQDGSIEALPAPGADIKLAGADKKVACVDDATSGHTHAAGTLMCPNTGTGNPVAITGATASATDSIAASEGAPNVKAAR